MGKDQKDDANEPLSDYGQPLTFEKVWQMFRETDKMLKETQSSIEQAFHDSPSFRRPPFWLFSMAVSTEPEPFGMWSWIFLVRTRPITASVSATGKKRNSNGRNCPMLPVRIPSG